MKILERYILSEFWLPLASGAGIITGVWLGIDKFKDVFKLLAKSGASYLSGFVILGLEIPHILSMTLPISILLGTFLTFQKLSSQSELIAMRAAGVSFARLMKAPLILGLLGVLAVFLLAEVVVPVSTPFAKKMYTYSLYEDPLPEKSKESFSYFERGPKGNLNRIFYVRSFNDERLQDVVILDFSKNNLCQIYTADSGEWIPKLGVWRLYNGRSSYIQGSTSPAPNPNDTSYDVAKKLTGTTVAPEESVDTAKSSMHLVTLFESTDIPTGVNPQKILANMLNVRDMNFMDLYKFISLHELGRLDTDKLNDAKVKFFNKFSYPFSCVFLAIIGACLGVTGRRKTINWGYILIGLVVFAFYMSQTMADSFGDSGRIAPALAVWLPNILMAGMAAIAFSYRANK